MATTSIPKRNMRSQPTARITNLADRLTLSYKCQDNVAEEAYFRCLFKTTEWKHWERDVLSAIAARGCRFEVTKKFFGTLVTVTGKRI